MQCTCYLINLTILKFNILRADRRFKDNESFIREIEIAEEVNQVSYNNYEDERATEDRMYKMEEKVKNLESKFDVLSRKVESNKSEVKKELNEVKSYFGNFEKTILGKMDQLAGILQSQNQVPMRQRRPPATYPANQNFMPSGGGPIICYRCQNEGHFARDCQGPMQGSSQQQKNL